MIPPCPYTGKRSFISPSSAKQARKRWRKVVIEGVNTATVHRKARSATDTGGIIHVDKPIDISNVAVISPSDGKPTRVGYKLVDGKKVRVCRRTGAELS